FASVKLGLFCNYHLYTIFRPISITKLPKPDFFASEPSFGVIIPKSRR
ncbi:unnamed protein product, partial [Brassica oleracea var. botrytis]